jgi:hypothetical protein
MPGPILPPLPAASGVAGPLLRRRAGGGAPVVAAELIVSLGQSNSAGTYTAGHSKAILPAVSPGLDPTGPTYAARLGAAVSGIKILNAPDVNRAASAATARGQAGSAFVNFDACRDSSGAAIDCGFGPELGFAVQRQIRSGQTVYMLRCSQGSTALGTSTTTNWNAATALSDAGNSLAKAARDRINVALAQMAAAGINSVKVIILWAQGEHDLLPAAGQAGADAYQSNITALDAYLGGMTVPSGVTVTRAWRIARTSMLAGVSRGVDGRSLTATVGANQLRFAAAVGGRVVDTNTLTLEADNIHYTPAAQIALGEALEAADADVAAYVLPTGLPASATASAMANRPVGAILWRMPPPSNTPAVGPGAEANTNAAYAYSATGLPPGCILDTATGWIEVQTPASLVTGSYSPVVRHLIGNGNAGVDVPVAITVTADNAATLDRRAFVLDPGSVPLGAVASIANADASPSGIGALAQATGARQPSSIAFPGTIKNGLSFNAATSLGVTGLTGFLPVGLDSDFLIGAVVRPATGGSGTAQTVLGLLSSMTNGASVDYLSVSYDYTNTKFGVGFAGQGSTRATLFPAANGLHALNATYRVVIQKRGKTVSLRVNGADVALAPYSGNNWPNDALVLASSAALVIGGRRNDGNLTPFTGTIGLVEMGRSASPAQLAALEARLAAWIA